VNFTPTERRIVRLLSDGLPHPLAALKACLDDELAGPRAFRRHLTQIRRKLRDSGEAVLAVYHNRTLHYQHVRLLAAADAACRRA
jgi:DNA-binding CsgD family transcriptional regulator